MANVVIELEYEFAWRTDQSATAEYELAWSTGRQRSFFYRVVGQGKDDICDPLQVDECCKKFVINIQARNIDDVCRKLKERIGVWPVEKIQRFSRPAERIAIEEDAAAGIDYICNIAEDVEFCKVPVCADFCVSFDLREYWGGYSVLEYAGLNSLGIQSFSISRKHKHIASGGFKFGGSSKIRRFKDVFHACSGGIGKIRGNTCHRSSHYHHVASGGLNFTGSVGLRGKNWKFKGGIPLISDVIELTNGGGEGWSQSSDGCFVCDLGFKENSTIVFSELYPSNRVISVVLEIDRFANGLVQDENVFLYQDGEKSCNLAKNYNWPLALPVTTLYEFEISNESPISVGICVRAVSSRPDLKVNLNKVKLTFIYNRNGLSVAGKAKVRFSNHHYVAQGGLKVFGSSSVVVTDFKPTPVKSLEYVRPSLSKGAIVRALDVSEAVAIIPMPQDEEIDLVKLNTTLTKCNCSGMPLSIPFSHNLYNANKLSQFAKRNGQVISKLSTLQYNNTNQSWQANFRYSGSSAMTTGRELWDVLFELQCSDLLGGIQIGQGVWRFGIRVIQRNLATGQDFDSRILVAFLPDPICSQGKEFRVKLTFDTSLGLASTNPISTIYEVVVHDNIGLFKSDFWVTNPNLLIDMSQTNLDPTPNRLPYNVGY